MSIQHCFNCDKDIDTDFDAEHFEGCGVCKYGNEPATKKCGQCGDNLCSGCGYTLDVNNESITLCNECYNDIQAMVNDDRNVGLLEEQHSPTMYEIDPERFELENL